MDKEGEVKGVDAHRTLYVVLRRACIMYNDDRLLIH